MWRTLTWCQRLNEHKNLIVRLKNQKQMWKRAWFGLQMSVFPLNSFLSFHKECKQLISSHILINCQVVPPKHEARKGGSRVTERSLQREEDGSDCWVDPGDHCRLILNSLSNIFSFVSHEFSLLIIKTCWILSTRPNQSARVYLRCVKWRCTTRTFGRQVLQWETQSLTRRKVGRCWGSFRWRWRLIRARRRFQTSAPGTEPCARSTKTIRQMIFTETRAGLIRICDITKNLWAESQSLSDALLFCRMVLVTHRTFTSSVRYQNILLLFTRATEKKTFFMCRSSSWLHLSVWYHLKKHP